MSHLAVPPLLVTAARRARLPALHVVRDTGDGPVVLFIHGIASSAATFDPVLPRLTQHRAVAIDLLGFGESPAPTDSDYSIEDHVIAVERTIEELDLRAPLVLVGHSMGALISSRLAARNAHLVRGLVLASPPVYVPPETLSDRADRATMEVYLALYGFLRANRDFSVAAARSVATFLPRAGLLDLTERTWHPFVRSLEHTIESQTTIDDIAHIEAPIEVVYGSLDPLVLREGIRILSRMRNVEVLRVFGADHVVRDRLATAIVDAIGRVDERSAIGGRMLPELEDGGLRSALQPELAQ